MSTLALTLTQPTQIAPSIGSDQLRRTERHIPGWVVRGALAAAWLRTNGAPATPAARERFTALFEGGVRFGPLFAAGGPPPRSAHEHKYGAESGCAQAVFDAAWRPRLDTPQDCPHCGQEWVPMPWRDTGGLSVTTRTSVQIDPANQVAAKGVLFSRERILPFRTSRMESIEETPNGARRRIASVRSDTTLSGSLVCSDPTLADELGSLSGVRIGGRRTTHGSATVIVGPADPLPPPALREDNVVILRFVSPAVFVDQSGRPVKGPGSTEIEEVLGVAVLGIVGWSRWGTVGGWHAASGLPKPEETVAVAGSTYAVRLASRPDAAALEALARRGLGLRRHEGFGHLGGPWRLSEPEESLSRRFVEAAAQLTDADLQPYLSLRVSQGRLPRDLADALRAGIAREDQRRNALELASQYGGRLVGPIASSRAEQLFALPAVQALAILARLEQS